MVDVDSFVRNYANAIIDGEAAVFAGAGVSMPSGYPSWSKLVKPLAREIGLDVGRESNYISLAQYYSNARRSRWDIEHLIRREFSKACEPSDDLMLLAQMPIDTYWTTNYDSLIEDSLRKHGKRCDSVDNERELSSLVPGSDAIVYKMHGDARHPDSCIITKDDYESYSTTHELFINHLKTALTSKTFLFIGYGFGDPNFEAVLARIRQVLQGSVRTHYYLARKVKKEGLSKKQFRYKKKQQRMFLDDLARYGIQAVLFDTFADISKALKDINKLVKCNTIFISGSAAEYGGKWDKNAAGLVYKLTSKLLKKGFRIITGHGQGVGSYVISTAITELNPKEFDKRLVIRAVPYEEKKYKKKYKKMMVEYRRSMTESAGIGIFLFGNKWEKGEIVNASGVREEYELMRSQDDKIIIPIPSTGYEAERIFKKEEKIFKKERKKNHKKSNENQIKSDVAKTLNNIKEEYDPDKIVKEVVALIQDISEGKSGC